MPELILHHYDMSPYAEKVRLMMGVKSLSWRSVQIPIVMPKPDLTELTGGYRRTPTLQIGADIYCDTKVCALALERFAPQPSLFPGDPATIWAMSRWAETSFMMAVTIFLGSDGFFEEDFIEDRKKMLPGADFSKAKLIVPAKLMQLRSNLDRLEEQLSDGTFTRRVARPRLAPRRSSRHSPRTGLASTTPSAIASTKTPESVATMWRTPPSLSWPPRWLGATSLESTKSRTTRRCIARTR